MKLHAIVEETDEPQFVAQISCTDYEDLGEEGLEQMAKRWCERKGYTYVDWAI